LFETISGFGFLAFDAADNLGDDIFSVVNINSGSAATGTLSTAAAITEVHIAAVPEPAAWAMMICGLLMTGSALRMRRTVLTALEA